MNPVSNGAITQPHTPPLTGTLTQRAIRSGDIFKQTTSTLTDVSDLKASIDTLYHSYKQALTPTMRGANSSNDIRDTFIAEFPKAIGISAEKAPKFVEGRGWFRAKITDTYTRDLAQAYLESRSQTQDLEAKEPTGLASDQNQFLTPRKGPIATAMSASPVAQDQQAQWNVVNSAMATRIEQQIGKSATPPVKETASSSQDSLDSKHEALENSSTPLGQEASKATPPPKPKKPVLGSTAPRAESKDTSVAANGITEEQKLADWDARHKKLPGDQDSSDTKRSDLGIARAPSQNLLTQLDAQALEQPFAVMTNVVGDHHVAQVGSAPGNKDEFLHTDQIVLEELPNSDAKTPNDFAAYKAKLTKCGVPVHNMPESFLSSFQLELSKIRQTGNAQVQGSGNV